MFYERGYEMSELDRIKAIIDRRNCFHLNDVMRISYCAWDDRKGCHSEFHASTVDEVREMVLDSDKREVFLSREVSEDEKRINALRSAQLNANLKGDRNTDVKLFTEWSKLSNRGM